jgi:hypothetical protein
MLRRTLLLVFSLLSVVGPVHATGDQRQPDAQDLAVAERFLVALDAGNWQAASKMTDRAEMTPGGLQQLWTAWAGLRGSGSWRGQLVPTRVYSREGNWVAAVAAPLLRSNGGVDLAMQVSGGKIDSLSMHASFDRFGVYARLDGVSYTQSNGARIRWRLAPSGQAILEEVVLQDGSVYSIKVIKPLGRSILGSFNSSPSESEAAYGTIAPDGTVTWERVQPGFLGTYQEVVSSVGNSYTRLLVGYGSAPFRTQFPAYALPQTSVLAEDDPDQATLAAADARAASIEPTVESHVNRQFANLQQLIAEKEAFWQRHEERMVTNDAMHRLNGALNESLAVATKEEAQSRARLEATLAGADGQPQAAATSGSKPSTAVAGAAAEPPTPGGAMTFMLLLSLDQIINNMNGSCYSNLVTIPGPPGWPVLDHTNDQEAAELVAAYIPAFEAKCRQAGSFRGSATYLWNARGVGNRLSDEFARQRRNKMFEVQVAP